jgi:hypothetical protein
MNCLETGCHYWTKEDMWHSGSKLYCEYELNKEFLSICLSICLSVYIIRTDILTASVV